ncbi:MAG TPA: isoprenyl transferase [Metalysinibacillus jejuensis]|jgi:undecaprenyl diphosphate synthase|uniref:Isoprenyl transferase n=1 Tax=Metalysinibacillus jejuensis TaxID=914327 RepID=A0A921NCJ0_9BACL|nr:isoprenyl transferase [Metalysinibacillus jejuensis]HJH11514.1 isoprenyl transferase [Metalysinibacillus jejuensis]
MFKNFLGNKANTALTIEQRKSECMREAVPSHIAIIMDGNGRWAKKRALPRVAGHREGMKTVKKITRCASEIGVKALTVYAFSTENWKRPKDEVDFLMRLPVDFLDTFLPELIERNVRVETIGDSSVLPLHTQKALTEAMETTKHNTGLVLNFALNYGSRDEMVKAMKAIMMRVAEGELTAEQVDEDCITAHLMTAHLPEPDLLIRTSGEVRLSNFMLWQLAYTELWFTDMLWPDFNEAAFLDAVMSYQKRNRRYGGLKGEETK